LAQIPAPPHGPTRSLAAVIVPVTPFQQNCSILWCTQSMRGAVVDPGGEPERILAAARQYCVKLEKILVTHGHLDHAGATHDLAERLEVPIEGPHLDDQFLIQELHTAGRQYGMPHCKPFTPDRWLSDGDAVTVGCQTLQVLHTPGHTPGHIVFFHENARLAMVGDVLFQGSIGRTDFPRGNHADLISAITTKLWPLGSDVTFIPGHGPASTFGHERRTNPFVGDAMLR